MFYGNLIYLAGLVICLLYGIGPGRIVNFIDMISFGFVVIPCILMLISTGYWKGYIKAFVYIFGKEKYNKENLKESMRAVKLTCISALIFGGLGVTISLNNCLHCMDLDLEAHIGADVAVAFISIFYALIQQPS